MKILLQGQNNVKIYIELKSEHHWAALVTRHQISLPGSQWCNIPNKYNNNENDKDDDAGNHGNNDDQVDDAGDQFVNITTMWWPQTRTPEYDRGAIAP